MLIKNKNESLDYLIKSALALCVLISLVLALQSYLVETPLWDLSPIIQAVRDYAVGVSPYRQKDQSMFIYHPFVLIALSLIGQFVSLKLFLACCYLAVVLWFLFESTRFLADQVNGVLKIAAIIVMALTFGGVSLKALLSGNFSAYFHLILISLMFNYSAQNRKLVLFLYGFSLICFSIVKPYFLAYILFYFLAHHVKKAIALSLMCCGVVALLWFSGSILLPDQYADFLRAMQYQLLTKDDLGGFSTLRLLGPRLGYQWAFLLHISSVGSLFVLLMVWAKRRIVVLEQRSLLLLLIIFIVLTNPRVVFYDFFASIFALFYLLFLTRRDYDRVLILGFPIAIYSQLTAHSIRWVIAAYAVVGALMICGLVARRNNIALDIDQKRA